MPRRTAREKIKTIPQLREIVKEYREQGRRVVFTNGCFDLLHPGHIGYLEKSRALGDALLVAMNSDASVKRLKGPSRPIQSEQARQEVMGALECVDWVTLFEEDTPAQIIRQLRPQVLAKGGDWALDRIVGREEVEATGGQVVAVPFQEGYSTTSIIRRIRDYK